MSKFDEMCEAHKCCERSWNQYRDRCYHNLITLYQGFIAYCDIPNGRIALAPLDKEIEPGVTYGPAGAIHFDTNDGYWHLGFVVTLTQNPNVLPQPKALLELAVREQDGKILVKRGEGDKPQEVNLSDQNQCAELYDGIVRRVKDFYSLSPDNLPQDLAVRKIGFTS